MRRLKTHRSPLASDLRHGLYRAQAERWMQAMILEDVTRIDVTLDPAHVYEQVFALGAGQHGIIDLLCVTRSRRLALLELKATENVNFAAAGCRLLLTNSCSCCARRTGAFRIPSRFRIAGDASDCVSGRAGAALSSKHRQFAAVSESRDRSDSHWTFRELAPRPARDDAAVNARRRAYVSNIHLHVGGTAVESPASP